MILVTYCQCTQGVTAAPLSIQLQPAQPADLSQATINQQSTVQRDTSEGAPLQLFLSWYLDPTHKLTASDLSTPTKLAQFNQLRTPYLSLGYSTAAVWLSLQVQFPQPVTARYFLNLDNPLLQQVDCYQIEAASPQPILLGNAGSRVPPADRLFFATSVYLPLPAPSAHSVQYLCKIVSQTSLAVPIAILSAREVASKMYAEHFWFGFVVGLLLLLMMANLFVWVLNRKTANAIYAVFVSSILMLFLAVTGVGHSYLWPTTSDGLHRMVPFSLALLSLTSYLFAREYFRQQDATTWPRILSVGAALSTSVMLFSYWLPYALATQLAMLNALLMAVILLLYAINCRRRHLLGASIFLLGRILILATGLIQISKTLGLIPAFYAVEYILFIGAIIEGMVLSAGFVIKNRNIEQKQQQAAHQILNQTEASLQAISAMNQQLAQQITEREQAEKVQHALFQISELSAADLPMPALLNQLHQVIATLMFAKNFYVALYDRQQDSVCFPYMVDEVDQALPAPDQQIPAPLLAGSWTMWILTHGKPLFGDADTITQLTGLTPTFGAVARCWLGFPLCSTQQQMAPSIAENHSAVFGVLCLQIYDDRPPYSQAEYQLLDYVSRHISQALMRQRYRQDLKATVEARTAAYRQSLQQVQNLLNNTGQGFLSCDASLQIQPEYSAACLDIFQLPHLAGNLAQLLANGDEKLTTLYQDVLTEVLQSPLADGMSNLYLSLLPAEREFHQQYYQMCYRQISAEQLLVIMTDITAERSLQRALQQQQAEAQFIVYALKHRHEVQQTLKSFAEFLQRLSVEPGLERAELKRQLHTFKGLLAQIACPILPGLLHDAEEILICETTSSATFNNECSAIKQMLQDGWQQIELLLQQSLSKQFLADETLIEVPAALMQQLTEALAARPDLTTALLRLQFQPLVRLLSSALSAAQRLANSQQKELQLKIDISETLLLDPDYYQSFVAVLPHLLRNAVDHGIEPPAERIAQGKSATATLTIKAAVFDVKEKIDIPTPRPWLRLEIQDDGQGIAFVLLRKKIAEQHLVSAAEVTAMSEQQLIDFIFVEALSTREEANFISGRGIGLAAVRQTISQYQGRIDAQSQAGVGTCFVIEMPLQPAHYSFTATNERVDECTQLTSTFV